MSHLQVTPDKINLAHKLSQIHEYWKPYIAGELWDIRWSHPIGRTKIRDAQNGFVGDFVQNVAQIAWAGQTDTATFVSDPASTR